MSHTDLVLSTVQSESKDHLLLIHIVFEGYHLISFLHMVDAYSRRYNTWWRDDIMNHNFYVVETINLIFLWKSTSVSCQLPVKLFLMQGNKVHIFKPACNFLWKSGKLHHRDRSRGRVEGVRTPPPPHPRSPVAFQNSWCNYVRSPVC